MSDAAFWPLFVTANIPVWTINAILTKAASEHNIDPVFINRWTLIEKRNQTQFQKPTISVADSFTSDFLDVSVQDIITYMDVTFSEKGDIANDYFALLDSQSVEDHSVLCVTPDSLSALDEAEIRVVWRAGGTRHDEALVRLLRTPRTHEATDEDFVVLARDKNSFEAQLERPSTPMLSHELRPLARNSTLQSPMQQSYENSTSNVVYEEEKTKLKDWYKEKALKRKITWLGIRFPAEESISGSCGLYNGLGWQIFTSVDIQENIDEVGVLTFPEEDSE